MCSEADGALTVVESPLGERSSAVERNIRAVLEAADEDLHVIILCAAYMSARAGKPWAARWCAQSQPPRRCLWSAKERGGSATCSFVEAARQNVKDVEAEIEMQIA